MRSTLRILHLEDDRHDAELVRDTLAAHGVIADIERVDREADYIAQLEHEFDLILADYSLPSFGGSAALTIAQTRQPDTPFIFVSGTLGEDLATEALKSGATDYVLKNRLLKLPHSVRRAISEVDERVQNRRASEALRESEARYRLLFESNPQPMWVYDRETLGFLAVNESALKHYGYAREAFLALTILDIRPPEDIPALPDYIGRQDPGIDQAGSWRHRKCDGSVIDVEITSDVIEFSGRQAAIVLANDITERKRGEEALRETNQRLELALADLNAKSEELAGMTQQLWQASKLVTMGELAASIAHELNNPLATVALRTEALLTQMADNDPRRAPLEVVTQEVDRMATLVHNLLHFSRRSHRQVSTVDVREEMTNSVEFIQYYLRNRKVTVRTDFAETLPTVPADRQQLRQLFLNLLTNAADAMPDGGVLTLRAVPSALGPASAVLIEFVDTGTGIAPDDLERVWNPFFTTKPEGKGTGLGLAICRRIVEEHRGSIEVESQAGQGTTVRFALPTSGSDVELRASLE